MDSNICFEMNVFVVEAIRGRCASFMIVTATVSEMCGGQTNVPIDNVTLNINNQFHIFINFTLKWHACAW